MPLLADHLYTSKIPNVAGLLTTVDNLPAILKRQYSTTITTTTTTTTSNTITKAYKPKSVAIARSALLGETPLDLTVKSHPQIEFVGSITPPRTPSPPKKRYKFALETSGEERNSSSPPLPPPPPPQILESAAVRLKVQQKIQEKKENAQKRKLSTTKDDTNLKAKEKTPEMPIQSTGHTDLKMAKTTRPGKRQKRNKATKKLKFDEDTSSPVSGTIIRRLEEIEDEDQIGDIDPEYNIVEVTEEAKAEIAAIVNVIGDYLCKLCRKHFDDAFELARHRCSCIVLLEYRCPECGKRFNCPANLASHQRWHKPRPQTKSGASSKATASSDKYSCTDCKKTFKRLAYLKKHQLTHNVPVKREERDTDDTRSNGSYYSSEELIKMEEEEDEKSVALEVYQWEQQQQQQQRHHHPNKLEALAQIAFHHSYNDDNMKYSSMSRGSTPDSMPSSPQRSRVHGGTFTEDENAAAAALATMFHNGPSVIRHTTLSV